MSSSTTRSNLHEIRWDTFRLGLETDTITFRLRRTQLQDVKNMFLTHTGSVCVRGGMQREDASSGGHFGNGATINIARYIREDTDSEVLIIVPFSSAGFLDLYTDGGINDYQQPTTGEVARFPQADNGYVYLEQWRDIIYVSSENMQTINDNGPLFSYNKTAVETNRASWGAELFIPDSPLSGNTRAQTSSFATGNYTYFFTVDFAHGDEFVAESLPIHNSDNPMAEGLVQFRTSTTSQSDGAFHAHVEVGLTSASVVDFKKAAAAAFSTRNDIRSINIYRSVNTTPNIHSGFHAPREAFFFIGAVLKEDWDNASVGDVLFTDAGGLSDASRPIPTIGVYFGKWMPRARFTATHKNRLWYAHVKIPEVRAARTAEQWTTGYSWQQYTGTDITLRERRDVVYHSEYLEMEKVRFTSSVPIGSDGEQITGILSFRNRSLFITKDNSCWMILGGDIERAPGFLDIEVENFSHTVGCVAPLTLCDIDDGIMFLSNRSVEFFDGNEPLPIGEPIDNLIQQIPAAMRPKASALWWHRERRYVLSFASANSDTNDITVIYDVKRRAWSKHEWGNPTAYGINAWVEKTKGNETGQVLCAIDHDDSAIGHIHQIDVTQSDVGGDPVAWLYKTSSDDDGKPDIIKDYLFVFVTMKTGESITVSWDVDDGKVTDSKIVTSAAAHSWNETDLNWQGAPLEFPDHIWDSGPAQNIRLVKLPQNVRGQRIAIKVSGEAGIQGTESINITVMYKDLRRIESA